MIKKIAFVFVVLAYIIPAHAMHTGQTRRESIYARTIALKQARRLSHDYMSVLCSRAALPKASVQDEPCGMFGAREMRKFSDSGEPTRKHPLTISFRGGCMQHILMWTMIASLLTQGAYAENVQQDTLLTVARTAASYSAGDAGKMLLKSAQQWVIHVSDGSFNGKLGGTADKFGQMLYEYREQCKIDPLKAQIELSKKMILLKTSLAAGAGAVATLPEGGVGAIPAGALTFVESVISESLGFSVNVVIDQIDRHIDHKIDLLERRIAYFILQNNVLVFKHVDHQLTEEQALNLGILAGGLAFSSAEFTSALNKVFKFDLKVLNAGLAYARYELFEPMSLLRNFGQDFEKNIFQNLLIRPDVKDEIWQESFGVIKSDVLQIADRDFFKSIMPDFASQLHVSQEKKYYFMGDAQRIMQHQMNERWKKDSSDVLRLGQSGGIDAMNQRLHEMQKNPLWQYEGAAGNAWYNEQQRRKHFGF